MRVAMEPGPRVPPVPLFFRTTVDAAIGWCTPLGSGYAGDDEGLAWTVGVRRTLGGRIRLHALFVHQGLGSGGLVYLKSPVPENLSEELHLLWPMRKAEQAIQ